MTCRIAPYVTPSPRGCLVALMAIAGAAFPPHANAMPAGDESAPQSETADWRPERDRLNDEALREFSAGNHTEAAAAGEQMLAIERQHLPEGAEDIVGSLELLAHIYFDANDWTQANSRWKEAVAWRESHAPNDAGALADARRGLAQSLYRLKQYDAAIPLFNAVIPVYDELGRAVDAAWLFDWIACCHRDAGCDNDAVGAYEECFARSPRLDHQEDLSTPTAELAKSLYRLNRYDEALAQFEAAAALYEKFKYESDAAWMYGWIGDVHRDAGRDEQAAAGYRECLARFAKIDGQIDVSDNAAELAKALYRLDRYDEAIAQFEKAAALYEKAENAANSAWMYGWIGDAERDAGRDEQAAAAYRECLARFAKFEHDLDISANTAELAKSLYRLKKYDEAIVAFQAAATLLDEADKALDAAWMFDWIGDCLVEKPDLAGAEAAYRKALARFETLDDRLAEATVLDDLATMLTNRGDYAEAEPYYRRALELRKKKLGERNADYATSVNNLAWLLDKRGDYAQAEPLYRQALAIRAELLGEEDPSYALGLNNLAALLDRMGDYARAEPLFLQALEIRRKTIGDKHPDYALTLNCLAALYAHKGDYARAEPLFQQALLIRKESLGEMHADYSVSLNDLACLYTFTGDYAQAEPLIRRTLEINKIVRGEKHPEYATNLGNLAWVLDRLGDYDQAERLFRQALDIYRDVLDEKHPVYALALNNVALHLDRRGDVQGALPLYRQALETVLALSEETAVVQDEQGQLALGRSIRFYLDGYLSCLLRSEAGGEAAFNAALRWKGVTLVRQRAARLAADSPELAPLLAELQDVARHWSALAAASRGSDSDLKARISELAARKERLEAELIARSKGFRQAMAPPTADKVLAALPPDAVLLDYLEFWRSTTIQVPLRSGMGARLDIVDGRVTVQGLAAGGAASRDGRLQPGDVISAVAEQNGDFTLLDGLSLDQVVALIVGEAGSVVRLKVRHKEGEQVEEERLLELTRALLPGQVTRQTLFERALAAFVVRPGRQIEMIDLGDATSIGVAIDQWRLGYGLTPEAAEAGRLLRERLWAPLEDAIDGARLVIVSPDGPLGKLPFAGLPGAQPDRYLIEDVALALVPVPQLIPALANEPVRKDFARELLVVGGVDYDRRAAEAPSSVAATEPLVPPSLRGASDAAEEQEIVEGIRWRPLAGTDGEALYIAGLFRRGGVDAIAHLRGSEATEEQVRRLAPDSCVIHLATHGFFATEDKQSALVVDASQRNGLRDNPFGDRLAAVRGYSPGLLSGLVLAGANDPPEIPEDPAALAKMPDNGYLTAEEIAFLPLNGVRLVVMSACESGLGEAAGGEGILGIQRAFQVAGARATIATLWKVNDLATQAFMEEFYRNYLERQMTPLEALRATQRWALEHPALGRGADAPPGQAEFARLPPQFWAAFTLSGDWQ